MASCIGPHHPAEVAHPKHPVGRLEVHAEEKVHRHLGDVAAVGVHGSLGLAGAAGGVEQHRDRFGVHQLAGDPVRLPFRQVAPAAVPIRVPVDRLAEVLVYDDVPDGRDPFQRGVEGRLHRDHRPAPQGRVRGQHRLRACVLQARPHRVLAEAREQRHRHRPDVLHGEEGGGHLRDHGHVEPDRIPPPETEGAEPAREPADLPVELPVGPLPDVAALALPADRGAVLGGGSPMPFDAVDDRVGPPAEAPSRPGEPPARVADALPGHREPEVEEADRGVPEPFRVLPAPGEERVVVVALDAHVPHEGHEVALFHSFGGRFPGESAHAGLLGGWRRRGAT